jgi:hypothetical protein
MKKCKSCGHKIPQARLKALPNTDYCVKCVDKSDTHKIPVVIESMDGTDVALVDPETAKLVEKFTKHEVSHASLK